MDANPATRISQDSVPRTGIVAVDALAGGTGGVAQYTVEALAPYTSTVECAGAFTAGMVALLLVLVIAALASRMSRWVKAPATTRAAATPPFPAAASR